MLLPTKPVFIPKQSVIEKEIYHQFDIQLRGFNPIKPRTGDALVSS